MVGYNENAEAHCGCGEYVNDPGCIVNCPVDISQVRNGAVCELGVLDRDDSVEIYYMRCLIIAVQFVWDGLYRCFYWLCCCGGPDEEEQDTEKLSPAII